MKTIAISIDEPTITAIDRIRKARKRPGNDRTPKVSRSAIVREALQEYVRREEARGREDADREALAKHRDTLAKQLAALVGDQADL